VSQNYLATYVYINLLFSVDSSSSFDRLRAHRKLLWTTLHNWKEVFTCFLLGRQ